ncbi:DUF4280 domain-containing protein [Paenibacillus durus]|uniref:DUF4280 domain-containing protein n=1 Tax=Paenibacillus durus ATCC 35681 TaxID=1333534 RepID=A0A0F7F9N8_PAEDU|nr:DUF4280 domain-containing protein [Paenibacillus durus]AKG35292.1 hypothetical protein VK70_12495 [Paenibacillus durus ATCC 35681]
MTHSYVVDGAVMQCSYGSQPGEFKTAAGRNIRINQKAQGNIRDFEAHINISSFGMCSSKYNPIVIEANKGNHQQLIPQPCQPSITLPWMNGKNDVYVNQSPALLICSTNICMWHGNISFTADGQE